MKVLVTGGAGYIGSHVVWMLGQRGHQPVVFDNLSTGHADAVGSAPLVSGELCDAGQVRQVFAEHRPEAVMHFAALALVFGATFGIGCLVFLQPVEGAILLAVAAAGAGVLAWRWRGA